MKPESSPIGEDEYLLRLVFEDKFPPDNVTISPKAFEPRDGRSPDTDGISLFRADCLDNPTQVKLVLAEEKRSRHGIVKIPVSFLNELGLTTRPSEINTLPGHVVIPELNVVDYKKEKKKFASLLLELAKKASENIVEKPQN